MFQLLGPANDFTLTGGQVATGLTEGVSWTGKIGSMTDPDYVSGADDFTFTVQWGDTTSSSCTGAACFDSTQNVYLTNCTGPVVPLIKAKPKIKPLDGANQAASCDIYGTHTWKEESEAGVPYTITISGNDSDQSSQPSNVTSTAQVNDNSLANTGGNSLTNSSGGTCNQFSACAGIVATFTDNNSFCNAEGEAISPTTGAPHYVITVNYGDGSGNQSPTAVTQRGTTCVFDVYGSHVYTAPGPYTITVHIVDEGCSDGGTNCDITITSSVTVSTPSGGTGTNVPYVSAKSLNGDTGHYLAFVARWATQYASLRGDLNYQDYAGGCAIAIDALGMCAHPGANGGYCSSYAASSTNPAYCHVHIDSIVCPSPPAGASVYGYWTEAGTPANKHFFRIDVNAGTPSGSFTINTTKIGGAAYTATLVAQTTVQCS
jgi:hypothetical protein